MALIVSKWKFEYLKLKFPLIQDKFFGQKFVHNVGWPIIVYQILKIVCSGRLRRTFCVKRFI